MLSKQLLQLSGYALIRVIVIDKILQTQHHKYLFVTTINWLCFNKSYDSRQNIIDLTL